MRPQNLARVLLAAFALTCSACANAPAQAPAETVAADSALQAQRLIALEGAQNFRDIGGYRTQDGRRVKWGLLFRSADLSALTDADIAALNRLNVHVLYDLRSTSERRADPDAWRGPGAPVSFSRDYETDRQIFAALRGTPTVESVHAAMRTYYPAALTALTPEYRDLFASLLEGQGATLYHCTAGKDRTGIATALILSALGLPRETIYADYLMSNRFYHSTAGAMGALPPDVAAALNGVDESYLRAAFDAIDAQYGSLNAYIERGLGVDAAGVARLRALYTE